jgi:cbb3-type cytochrome oxidase subunit 3
MVVRQADAHAWSEVWFEDRGWVRVDPTSAVSPARIEYNLDQAIPANENPRLLLRRHSELLAKLNLVWDSINNSWNEWILGYGPEMQQLFLTYLGIQNTAAYNLVLLLTFSLFVCIAVIAYFSFRRAKRQRADKVHNLYLKLCKKLSKAGYIRPLHTGPWDYLKLIRKENPRLAAKLKPIILIYIALRYRAERSSDSFRRLQYLVRSLRVNEFQKSQQKSAFTSSGLF